MLGDPHSPMRQKVELKLAMLDIDELAVKKTSDYLNALIFDTDTKRWTERPCEQEEDSESSLFDPILNVNMSICYDLVFANGTALTISFKEVHAARFEEEAHRSLLRNIDILERKRE